MSRLSILSSWPLQLESLELIVTKLKLQTFRLGDYSEALISFSFFLDTATYKQQKGRMLPSIRLVWVVVVSACLALTPFSTKTMDTQQAMPQSERPTMAPSVSAFCLLMSIKLLSSLRLRSRHRPAPPLSARPSPSVPGLPPALPALNQDV